jgi:hypothetical protein
MTSFYVWVIDCKSAATDTAIAILKLTNEGIIRIDEIHRFAKTDDKRAPDGYLTSKIYVATVLNPIEQRRKIRSSVTEEEEDYLNQQ